MKRLTGISSLVLCGTMVFGGSAALAGNGKSEGNQGGPRPSVNKTAPAKVATVNKAAAVKVATVNKTTSTPKPALNSRDHRGEPKIAVAPKVSAPPKVAVAPKISPAAKPIVRDHRGETTTSGPITSSGGKVVDSIVGAGQTVGQSVLNGAGSVANSIGGVFGYDNKVTPAPTGVTTAGGAIVRDHRADKKGKNSPKPWSPAQTITPPPVANGGGGVTVTNTNGTPIKPITPPPVANGGGGVTVTNTNGTPIKPIRPGVVGPVKPPKNPILDTVGPIKNPILEPVKPPKNPIGPVKPPMGPGVVKPPKNPILDPIWGGQDDRVPVPPTGQPVAPPAQPQGGNHGHGGFNWSSLPFGLGFGQGGFVQTVAQPVSYAAPMVTETVVAAPSPVAVESALPRLSPGDEVSLSAGALGAAGQAMVQVGELALPVEVLAWDAESVTVRIPAMKLAQPLAAQLIVARADGSIARTLAFQLEVAAVKKF